MCGPQKARFAAGTAQAGARVAVANGAEAPAPMPAPALLRALEAELKGSIGE